MKKIPAMAARALRERRVREFNKPRYTDDEGNPISDPFIGKLREVAKAIVQYRQEATTAYVTWRNIYAIIRGRDKLAEEEAQQAQAKRNDHQAVKDRYRNCDGSEQDPFVLTVREIGDVVDQYQEEEESPDRAHEAWRDIYALVRGEEALAHEEGRA